MPSAGAVNARVYPRGYEKLVVSTTAVTLAAIPSQTAAPVIRTLIRVTGAGIRYRDDGTNPTASEGFPLGDGDILEYEGPPQALRLIRSGAADATLFVLYYS
jgi:hypothetical protein